MNDDLVYYLHCVARTLPDNVSKETCLKIDAAGYRIEALQAELDEARTALEKSREALFIAGSLMEKGVAVRADKLLAASTEADEFLSRPKRMGNA